MDGFDQAYATMSESAKASEATQNLRGEIEKVLGGTLEGAFELKHGLGLVITIRKDSRPFALVVQRPGNDFDPKKDTDVYITEGIGK